jgi:hypothetical protein
VSGYNWKFTIGPFSQTYNIGMAAPGTYLETGLETNSDHTNNLGASNNLSYRTRQGTNHPGWNDSHGSSQTATDWRTGVTWILQDYHLHYYTVPSC